jgi:hypothetical protein
MNFSFGSKIFLTLLFLEIFFASFYALCAAIWPGMVGF